MPELHAQQVVLKAEALLVYHTTLSKSIVEDKER